MTLLLSVYFINNVKRTFWKRNSLLCFRLWRSELRHGSSLKMRELYFSETLTPSILHCVVTRLDVSAETVPVSVRYTCNGYRVFFRGLSSRGAALKNLPHSAENKGKYCTLPPLRASGDIHLFSKKDRTFQIARQPAQRARYGYWAHKLFVGLIRRTARARAQFSGCSSTTNAHSETGQTAVCCQNLLLGALSSCSAPSVLVGVLFKKFGFFWTRGDSGTCDKGTTRHQRKCDPGSIPTMEEILGTVYR
jgi:hypothetical protein